MKQQYLYGCHMYNDTMPILLSPCVTVTLYANFVYFSKQLHIFWLWKIFGKVTPVTICWPHWARVDWASWNNRLNWTDKIQYNLVICPVNIHNHTQFATQSTQIIQTRPKKYDFAVPVRIKAIVARSRWDHAQVILWNLLIRPTRYVWPSEGRIGVRRALVHLTVAKLSLIHIWRCRRSTLCRSRWSPYH